MTNPEPDKTQLTIAAYRAVFSPDDAKAKRVLDDLSWFCFENRDAYDMICDRKTSYNLGANSVIRRIRDMLKHKTEPEYKDVISERKPL